jgi:hypothetical protein
MGNGKNECPPAGRNEGRNENQSAKQPPRLLRRMPSSGVWRKVGDVRTDVSEERIASIIKVSKIGELGTSGHPDDGGHRLLRNVGS